MSKKPRSSHPKGANYVLGRVRFAKISEVEGIQLSGPMKRAFAEFDRKGISAAERRQRIIDRFKVRAG